MSFEEIEHTADCAFRATGSSFAELLENAARAMQTFEEPCTAAEPSTIRDIQVEGVDRESLLINWLNEILFLREVHQLVCDRFHVDQILDQEGYHLHAQVEARECSEARTHIKAATFHNLKISESSAGLQAEVVLDV